ncbi:MAG: sigma 54-interacting transcriptional regulator [Fimbriiglobus sp.]|jgi:transcriptional regulator with PAS, ATPase and Fis domain|nr:sigma 54-interacting transcriptional regulator [Fimbriiglobus sp.]
MPDPHSSRFAWRTLFARSRTAVFVVSGDRRLRYANPAWEQLVGKPLSAIRGSKFSAVRRSMSPFAPPPEVWAGKLARVRRTAPSQDHGPPWWDLTFLPLLGDEDHRVIAVIGTLSVVGEVPALPRVKVPASLAALRAEHADFYSFERIAGPAEATERLLSQVRAAAIGEMPVWLTGEPGSGKETIARVVHHNSPRRERAFVGLCCGGLQPYLIDGLLFGKGGASGGKAVGTLYLKNPQELSPPTQQRILEWCDTAAGPRLICGSTTPAEELVKAGQLARPFFTRFAAFEITVPPLRSRLDDLPKFFARLGRNVPASEVLAMLRAYSWPGNLRELAAVATNPDGVLTKDHLPRVIRERHLIATHPPTPTNHPKLDDILLTVEKRLISNALAEAGSNQTLAAERLGIPRSRLVRRLAALGLAGGDPS